MAEFKQFLSSLDAPLVREEAFIVKVWDAFAATDERHAAALNVGSHVLALPLSQVAQDIDLVGFGMESTNSQNISSFKEGIFQC